MTLIAPLPDTPLGNWLNEHHISTAKLADELRISRARAYMYVTRKSMARGAVLLDLLEYTGLPLADLIPLRLMRQKRVRRYDTSQRRVSP